jgi:hypothetical protein
MLSACYRAVFFAAFFVIVSVPASAQQGAASAAADTADYLPPAHLIAKSPRQLAAKSASPEQTAKPAGQKTIGLISIVGDTFTVKTIGIMVFGNAEDKYPIPGWKVNDRVAADVAGLLKKNFRVKRIPATEADFASVYAAGGLFRDITAEFDTAVRKVAANQPADYYLVISRMVSPYGSTNQYVAGLGVTRTGSRTLGAGHDTYHALTMMSVYDAQLKPIRIEHGTIGQDTLFAPLKGPHLIVDEEAELLPEDPKAALDDSRARQAVLDLLDKSLATTVPKLFAAD